jgi:riboflavin kinase/FMN adenylyltransferase
MEGLRQAGVERAFVQHFNRDFASLTAEQFIERVLADGVRARHLLVGDDFRFGARRAGDVALLRSAGQRFGFEVEQIGAVMLGGERVSSSRIRAALSAGNLALAGELLGHPYAISGRVLHGSKLGRQIGFPTLNLRVAHRRPALHGIFAVRVHGIGSSAPPSPAGMSASEVSPAVADRPAKEGSPAVADGSAKEGLRGVASVGLRPSVDDSGRWLLEVHLFDFSEEVYGRLVKVQFVQKLRDEARFDSIQELAAAIRRDAEQARAIFDKATA